MKNGFLTLSAPKNPTNKLKWRVALAMLAAMALLFAFQGFSRADDDSTAIGIKDCGYQIIHYGRYFLAKDLTQCMDFGVSITASDVKLELRGHTIQGIPNSSNSMIIADGGATGISKIEIEGPGTVTGGNTGIEFENAHWSQVRNVVVVLNNDGIGIGISNLTNDQTTASTDNEFRDNVVTTNYFNGIKVNVGNKNDFIHNNLSGNQNYGLLLLNANGSVARQNTVDSNGLNGIEVGTLGSGNTIDDNTALGNGFNVTGFPLTGVLDLVDANPDCTHNTWTDNSFNFASPSCIK